MMRTNNVVTAWCVLGLLFFSSGLAVSAAELGGARPKAEDRQATPVVAPASPEAEQAIKRFSIPPGFKVELVAAEPMLANPVAFCIDEKGRFFISETHRYRSSVLDIRHYMFMLEDDMAVRTVEEREAMTRRHFGPAADQLAIETEVVRLVEDTNGDGQADRSTVFADGFNTLLDGIASGVLARQGKVYFTNIPHLWELQDTNGDGQADQRRSLSHGYGVRFSYTGHDLHGLALGPDGKLYFSFGDRGAHVKTKEGKTLAYPDEGAVFRCNLDGSEMEMVHRGLRNPQELAFDDYGNLFTGDNDSDQGDRERWVYVVEGGDSGWRVGYQHAPLGRGGPWISEKLWQPASENTAAYLLPPIALINDGPSGLTFNPGTGFPEKYQGHFFLAHFKGAAANSGIQALLPTPKGASFELSDAGPFIWNTLVTDVDFGYDGSMYFTDWHHDWPKSTKGRIYRVSDPASLKDPAVAEVKKIFAAGFDHRREKELTRLLAHKDKRVRQEAQFALAARGEKSAKTFASVARKNESQLARLHAIWGLGQIGSHRNANRDSLLQPIEALLADKDSEVRAQAAKVIGDSRVRSSKAVAGMIKLLGDPNARVRYFAALGLGKMEVNEAFPHLIEMIRANADQDLYLRHAGVMALTLLDDKPALLRAAQDESRSVRLATLLAMRRLEMAEIATFLSDAEPLLALEAARAINDEPIPAAFQNLAALIHGPLPSEPIALRAINAAFRLGEPAHATALAALANRAEATPIARSEALFALAHWGQPAQRDRVVGNYRPLPPRDGKVAAEAVRPGLANILSSASSDVRQAALEAVAQLQIHDAAPVIARLIPNARLEAELRVQALQVLAALNYPGLSDLAARAARDHSELVRTEANRLLAELHPGKAVAPLAIVLETGTLAEKQGALQTLAKIESAESTRLLETWMDRLLAGELAPELHFDVLEAVAQRSGPELQKQLAQYHAARRPDDSIGAFRELLHGGNVAKGKNIFYERVEASCFRCHKLGGEGGDVGPVLDGIAARQSREYLLESLVDPNRVIAPGFENVMITMANGAAYAGVLKEETETEIVLDSPEDGLLKLKKTEIQTRDQGMSGMPAGLETMLSKRELRDLVEFLSTLQ